MLYFKKKDGSRVGVSRSTPLPRAFETSPNYETVAASQTDQVMGATGAIGDVLDSILVVPASTSPGAVQIKDGAGSAITVFAGGASSVADLKPFRVPVGLIATGAGWKLTTGANVSVVGMGLFT
jgi:hypothetical protein